MKISVLYVNQRAPRRSIDFDLNINGKAIVGMAATVALVNLALPGTALGADANLAAKITKAAQPIKDLLIGIADPVCYLVFAWGLLECMLGKGSSGLNRMKYAALGYAGLNWLPVLMEILRNARP